MKTSNSRPTVKQFPILSIDNKNGLKIENFKCPNIYGDLDERVFKHKFKNGVEAIVTKVSKFSYHRTIFEFQSFQKNIQSNPDNQDFELVTQYSEDFGGFITIFLNH